MNIYKIMLYSGMLFFTAALSMLFSIKEETVYRESAHKESTKTTASTVAVTEVSTKEYGFWDIFNVLDGGGDIKLIKIQGSENGQKSATADVEIEAGEGELPEFIDYMKRQENFVAVSKITLKGNPGEQRILLTLEFRKDK